jgi:DHA1 family inner membrane transport protein
MAGAAVVAANFAATPFLLPDVADRLAIDIGATGLLSTAQVGSFAAATFLAGRLFKPRGYLHYWALGILAVASFGSSLATNLPWLLVTRVVAGLGMGTLTWIAWADATRFARGLGDVAAIAPLTAAIVSPIFGWVIGTGGYPLLYAVLAAVAAAGLVLRIDVGDMPKVGKTVSPSQSNRVLLFSLGILTLGGSSVFVFSAATAESVQGLSALQVSWALSVNAITGVVATRVKARPGTVRYWIAATAAAALAVGLLGSPTVFYLALAIWGFAFWMAVPAVLKMLAEWSLAPNERMGDAQAAMAVGRMFGPVVGGLAIGSGHFGRLSVVGAVVMTIGAVSIGLVESYRRAAAR